MIVIPEGLPAEFSDYLEGALAWRNPAVTDPGAGREAWERLLALPRAERHFKSIWAAFMLGRSWEKEDLNKAAQYFRQVRDLARQGFADSAGLAAASLGLEARIGLHQQKFERAIELYLEQWATGDVSAVGSLRAAARAAIHGSDEALQALAKNPRTQRAITAYLVATPSADIGSRDSDDKATHAPGCARRWLEAVEAAEVKDVESAEKLALAAYQNNEMDIAQRWIKRARNSPVAQWVQAKMLFRAGKVDAAAALLTRFTAYFPIKPPTTNEAAATTFQENLFVPEGCYLTDANCHLLGELGVLRLARREYAQALDALLNAGFWMEAAYVAERVLTTDELKAYVDTHWPPVGEKEIAEEKEKYPNPSDVSPMVMREKIRYVLARRLARVNRGNEAREYYPENLVPQFDALAQALTSGWDESLPASDRTKALFEAAGITYTNGMQLLSTEVEPDWHVWDGNSEQVATASMRATNESAKVLLASREEVERAAQHHADPEQRFHYRYQAAFLAWEAAKLMPNDSEETARVLWTGGGWLKNRNPQTADLFYKALVRRNRKTALGAEADRRRWFPEWNEKGSIIPQSKEAEPPADQPAGTPAAEPES